MILAPMRFKGYTWHHNPKNIEVSNVKSSKEIKEPYAGSVLQSFGRKSRVIKGTGELYGSDCLQQYEILWQLYVEGGSGLLSVPEFMPFYAEFSSLSFEAQPQPDVLLYSFTFTECMQNEMPKYEESVYTVKSDGENLWDIANSFGKTVESLVVLNTQLKYPDNLKKGEVVKLV